MTSLPETSSIALDADLDLLAAVPLKASLVEAVDRGTRVMVDASKVERLSTPCAQVLISAARTLADQDNRLVLEGASEAFTAAFSDLGLDLAWQRWVETR